MFSRFPIRLKEVEVAVPFGLGKVVIRVDNAQRRAAWSLYVELVTRIATQQMGRDEGHLREALTSLHALFSETRSILREAGPRVGARAESVGGVAISVLNDGVRPFLSRWHPALLIWEVQRGEDVSPKDHEMKWEEAPAMRSELAALQEELSGYASALQKIGGFAK